MIITIPLIRNDGSDSADLSSERVIIQELSSYTSPVLAVPNLDRASASEMLFSGEEREKTWDAAMEEVLYNRAELWERLANL